MAITVDATVATETANSYCDVAYADDYFDNHYNSTKTAAWVALQDGAKKTLLVSATKSIEKFKFTEPTDPSQNKPWFFDPTQGRVIQDNYLGYIVKYNYFQKLQFPTSLNVTSGGVVFMPEEVKMANCEQAIYLATVDDSPISNRSMGVIHDSINVGGVALSQRIEPGGHLLAPMAAELLSQYMLKNIQRNRRS
jgi:hypothetical protein